MTTMMKALSIVFGLVVVVLILTPSYPKQAHDEFYGSGSRFKEVEVITPNTVVAVDTKTGAKIKEELG